MTVVAEPFGLPDVELKKVCIRLKILAPTRGYWAGVRAEKAMKQPRLPELNASTTKSDRATAKVRQQNRYPVSKAIVCSVRAARNRCHRKLGAR
ncbi:hypothetical protein [Crenobacter cavernae]|uniref:Uncharacterized protein n=1 Tax=Crenobacter cavernae TaxID=2290923 RepID=A0A345Y3L0_9NEIS|nr:hypothetical protein [Crenobacter cavernae]AXK38512.1 hypothetical protein DWG20_03215 [Crenobacter cavernae]